MEVGLVRGLDCIERCSFHVAVSFSVGVVLLVKHFLRRVSNLVLGAITDGRISCGRISYGRISYGRISCGRISYGRISCGRNYVWAQLRMGAITDDIHVRIDTYTRI